MTRDEEGRPREVVLPARNFTLMVEERVRALAAGLPAFAVRRRRIEDLEAAIGRSLDELEAKTGMPLDAAALPYAVRRDIERLNQLIDNHNRYYPIEARLPTDVRTGQLMDWGEPWIPMTPVSVEALIRSRHHAAPSGE
jgi:hypothetical protein